MNTPSNRKPDNQEEARFWNGLDSLVHVGRIEIDRPKGSCRPMYPDLMYPCDYGHVVGSLSSDGAELDVWIGSACTQIVCGFIVTVDRVKADSEVKVLLGCSHLECDAILAIHNRGQQSGIIILRPESPS